MPTDCPQRDERLGWTGDAQVYVHTADAIADVQAFFRKWLVDLTDAQRADGQFPKVAPSCYPGWTTAAPPGADAGVICPWEVYQAYGDRALLARQYPSMVRFVEFCRNRSKEGVLPPDNFHCLRRLAERQRRHAEGSHLHGVLRPQRRSPPPLRPKPSVRPRTLEKYADVTDGSRRRSARSTSPPTGGSAATRSAATSWRSVRHRATANSANKRPKRLVADIEVPRLTSSRPASSAPRT